MTLQQLKYAVEIARCGSITKATRQLFISQPSLSNAIMELETEIGITIFNRTNRGITVSAHGAEFLGYAKQVIEQVELLESRYSNKKITKQSFSVSTQHYAFAVSAFVNLIKGYDLDEYEFSLRETRTYEIIEDVKNLRSEIGILYLNEFNSKVLNKFLRENNLIFKELFKANPHIFISSENPLANKKYVTLKELESYPYLSFEQGEFNSFYFSEEIQSTLTHKKSITVSDRATLFNLLIGLNGYTISTGVISHDLNGNNIISVPLELEEEITIGYIIHENISLSKIALDYVQLLKETLMEELNQV
ncbi:LysR family transcriptional regulator [Clostridium saccharobutylicum]|uniref:Transcriptional regulator, LysR family n=1 Tax=Clostridium saccharobutylicum DSM 13864 TaxID=1345695 RepID=U5MUM7_CLOSA|nr:LysR family transcriptional regulator [Clostridium saccharobutylicum]AGX44238.1 transcriptional regulator, LysR family [Clostridium saccharobutylicum DSM 13864]AQR91527.1 HTH-type transcriptional regulator CysB [Clostridium saccharobutylicum]AQS01432.1 HTH-type transcriptional regulator CysB [Clostridium saccharobutylicum]AQS11041.1 HTH-type transcriptional regulator CysB [Clostridium saccharobutylicum]AQS15415.1 HTH-type transcriptional regulator CysB [Clostridium saccharobutylicum]